jgi:hypothetical protein
MSSALLLPEVPPLSRLLFPKKPKGFHIFLCSISIQEMMSWRLTYSFISFEDFEVGIGGGGGGGGGGTLLLL